MGKGGNQKKRKDDENMMRIDAGRARRPARKVLDGKMTSGKKEQPPFDYPVDLEAGRKRCPHFGRCGGCQLLSMPYEEQLRLKQAYLERQLAPFVRPEPIIGMAQPLHYRNKVHAVFGSDRRGNVISGVYRAGSHEIVPVDRCLLEDERADAIIVSIRQLVKSFRIKPYDEDRGMGFLRHVLVRTGHATGQIMVVLVTASPVFPSRKNFVAALRQRHPEITTVVQNINDRDTTMVLGKRDVVLCGKGYIEDVLCGLTFRISPQSFYQVNSAQTERLYQTAIDMAGLNGKEEVLDAYCGIGTIGLIAASHAGHVTGVELNPDAVRDAKKNALANAIENVSFYEADAGRFMTELAGRGETADVLFMDPPRSGSSKEFLQAVKKLSPKKIVYISCEVRTLVRDLHVLAAMGYRAEQARGVDMFGETVGIETVCLLSKWR